MSLIFCPVGQRLLPAGRSTSPAGCSSSRPSARSPLRSMWLLRVPAHTAGWTLSRLSSTSLFLPRASSLSSLWHRSSCARMFVSWLFPFVRFLRSWFVSFVSWRRPASSRLQAMAMKQDDASFVSIKGSLSFLMLYRGMDPLKLIIFLAEFSPQALVGMITTGTSLSTKEQLICKSPGVDCRIQGSSACVAIRRGTH